MGIDFYADETTGNTSRALSLLLAVAYVIAASLDSGQKTAIQTSALLLLPLACIWFPQTLASYTGFIGRGQYIDRESSPIMVWFLGWVLILLPFIIFGLEYLMTL
jgi:hypothetical protein